MNLLQDGFKVSLQIFSGPDMSICQFLSFAFLLLLL